MPDWQGRKEKIAAFIADAGTRKSGRRIGGRHFHSRQYGPRGVDDRAHNFGSADLRPRNSGGEERAHAYKEKQPLTGAQETNEVSHDQPSCFVELSLIRSW